MHVKESSTINNSDINYTSEKSIEIMPKLEDLK